MNEMLNSITITSNNPVSVNIDYKTQLNDMIEKLKKIEQPSVENLNTFNMYKNFLDFWYYKMFNNIEHFQKTKGASSYMSSQAFTRDLRTVSFNLGRQTGTSTAIVEFIEEHPELDIKIICPSRATQLELEGKFKTRDASKYFKRRGTYSEDIDIIFIDCASYFELNSEQSTFLSDLNSNLNKNQWVIKFG